MKKQLNKKALQGASGGAFRDELNAVVFAYFRSSEEGKRTIIATMEQIGLKNEFMEMVNIMAPLFGR